MQFTHKPLELPYLDRENIDGVRFYKVPDSDGELVKLVSITSVTSHWKKDQLKTWRERVGEEEANRITKKATSRGKDMHTLAEYYLNNDKLPQVKVPLAKILFNTAKPALNKIDNILAQERSMYSMRLGIAGTVDCIAEYEGELSIIDFKTSSKKKKDEWIKKYYLQATAYSLMWEELTGIKITQIVILISGEDGSREEYIRNRDDYVEELKEVIAKYNEQ